MSRSVNNAILLGNLGEKPELRYTNNGIAVTSFSLATNNTYTVDGEKKETVEWHKIVAWRKLAEIVAQYCDKGSKVYIEGRLQTRKWEKDGVTHYSTEIVADELVMLDGKKETADANAGSPDSP
jgi:single-strand DNA-binding protein